MGHPRIKFDYLHHEKVRVQDDQQWIEASQKLPLQTLFFCHSCSKQEDHVAHVISLHEVRRCLGTGNRRYMPPFRNAT